MSVREEHKPTVLDPVRLHHQTRGDAQGLLGVLLRPSLDELDLCHERVDELVLDLGLGLVLGSEDGCLPHLIDVLHVFDPLLLFERILHERRQDEVEAVVGRLTRLGGLLVGVTYDAIGRFVDLHFDGLDLVDVVEERVVVHEECEHAVDGTCGLVFVEAQLEVHVHDAVVAPFGREVDVEWRFFPLGGLVQSEECLGVSEHVCRTYEALLRTVARNNGHFGADRRRGPLGV